jgi:hypothetical protein
VRLMRGLGEGFRAFGRGERSGAGGQPPVLPEEASAGESE